MITKSKLNAFWISVLIILLSGLSLGLWLLKSSQIANTPTAINFRRFYYLNILPKIGVDLKLLPFNIIAMQEMNSPDGILYGYVMVGKFKNIDFENQILYLQTKNKITYGFKYSLTPNDDLFFLKGKNGVFQKEAFTSEPFELDEKIFVQWTDKRVLSRIIDESNLNDKNLINQYIEPSDFLLVKKM